MTYILVSRKHDGSDVKRLNGNWWYENEGFDPIRI